MGVSFKVSRDGTRFRHKAIRSDVAPEDGSDDNENSRLPGEYELNSIGSRKLEANSYDGKDSAAVISGPPMFSEGLSLTTEDEVSFSLNLFSDGYSIGKHSEVCYERALTFMFQIGKCKGSYQF